MGQLTVGQVGSQPIGVAFTGPPLTHHAGLLTVRALDQGLGVLADLAQRLPDPRAPRYCRHPLHDLLTQQVYQQFAGSPDANDATALRHDALSHLRAGRAPDPDRPLASTATLTRFHAAATRRQADRPTADRPVLLEVRAAQVARVKALNAFLVDLCIRSRRTPPTYLILDLDPTDDPVHGRQALAGDHGYYRQPQYFPLRFFEGTTGFPLGAWLRTGAVGAGGNAIDGLAAIVRRLRQAWPDVVLLVRGANGVAGPDLYDDGERAGLRYALGFACNAAVERRTAQGWAVTERYDHFDGHRPEPHLQRLVALEDDQAASWSRLRRVLVKVDFTPQGAPRRGVVTNRSGDPAGLYRGFYVGRGAVPEQPIGELKNDLHADRLAARGFCANAFRRLLPVVADALVVLYREACAAVPAVATATVGTLRERLWRVAAGVQVQPRQVTVMVAAAWPAAATGQAVQAAVTAHVAALTGGRTTGPPATARPPG